MRVMGKKTRQLIEDFNILMDTLRRQFKFGKTRQKYKNNINSEGGVIG